jgi:hypothetical protein
MHAGMCVCVCVCVNGHILGKEHNSDPTFKFYLYVLDLRVIFLCQENSNLNLVSRHDRTVPYTAVAAGHVGSRRPVPTGHHCIITAVPDLSLTSH